MLRLDNYVISIKEILYIKNDIDKIYIFFKNGDVLKLDNKKINFEELVEFIIEKGLFDENI